MMSNKAKLIVILGPTASGKTELAVKLAKKLALSKIEGFNGVEIVSADSRQIYKEMNIGTGKITKKEMEGIPHYLLDVVSPKRHFSVSQYQKLVYKNISKILKKPTVHTQGKIPFLVGGSPFYIYSVVEGWLFPKMKPDWKLRKELEKKSKEELFLILKKVDRERAKTIEKENKRRLIRAIEIAKTFGRIPKLKKKPQFLSLLIGIKKRREELKKRISKRVNKMIELGLEKEVGKLVKKYGWIPLLQTIGYGEWLPYFEGRVNKKEVEEKIKKNTFQFAKRQMTWFKRDKRIKWIKNYREAEILIENFIK